MGSDQCWGNVDFGIVVSIHAPAWGATVVTRKGATFSTCFNPRSRMGSDEEYHDMSATYSVSIHAPAWGATLRTAWMMCSKRFQSTLPHGERHQAPAIDPDLAAVSIHAPAWGATLQLFGPESAFSSFNPRSRMGSDLGDSAASLSMSKFQSTLPHGERLGCCMRRTRAGRFQSTLPHGERHESKARDEREIMVSIHAPAWGATSVEFPYRNRHGVSIHAPAWGATVSGVEMERAGRCFNPRSRMGSDNALHR